MTSDENAKTDHGNGEARGAGSAARGDREYSGLGLSLVKSSAELLGGSRRASLEGGKLTVLMLWDA